jgi:hypothetical protein
MLFEEKPDRNLLLVYRAVSEKYYPLFAIKLCKT